MIEPRWFRYYARLPIWTQNAICSFGGIRMRRERYNKQFWKALEFMNAADRWSRAQLREYQNNKLRELVKGAYEHTPYWREVFDQHKLRPDDIRSPDDLPKLPILDRETVYHRWADMVRRDWPKNRLVEDHTGGTTGASLRLMADRDAGPWHWAAFWRHRARFGFRPLSPFVVFAGRPVVPMACMKPPFWRRNIIMHQTYVSVHHMTEQNMPALAAYLCKRNVPIYNGYPSALYLVACHLLDNNIRLPDPPKMVFTGSETLLPHQREAMRRAFQCDVADHYGASELNAFISECEHHSYHLELDYGVIELIALPGGATPARRIISTGLINPAMPMFRYDIGDLAVPAADDRPCPCGRDRPAVERIEGRNESYVITPDGRQLSRLTFLFKGKDDIREAQLVQDSLDHLVARIVRREGYSQNTESAFLADMRTLLGDKIRIDIEYLTEIPREANGKFRHIVSSVFKDRYRHLVSAQPAAESGAS